jgi:hypothetical protein
MKTKTSELTGDALDWAVAKCEGVDAEAARIFHDEGHYNYSTNWAQGGPIIERERVCVVYRHASEIWLAYDGKLTEGWGQTPLIAAMRCYVASKLGDEVAIPEGLI